ncbi:tetratricopeptide repeat protein 38-like [Impatiens glandulifera]|uniref:tetratricopeptide repeat protein 38-like n=1 Tax=Impatiens glandulifera TaxID=253017 RepID=UPI001FB15A7C|nr:tetratricopeptide repeat protein 38-like [Impatiens glandulifera]
MGGLKLDKWGYEVNTSSDACIDTINSYYLQVLSYGRDRSVILEASRHDPNCVLANILSAHFLCSSNPSLTSSHLKAAKSQLVEATAYEKAVYDTIIYLISDDRDDDTAVALHLKFIKDFPKDLISLKRVQIICFYMGRPDLSLDLVQQVLLENQQENYIYGMLAFPLLELGRMEEAEKAAIKGFDINKDDCWSQHALCHVLQHKCRFEEAVKFMEECSHSWNSLSSFMYTHNWWHVALCHLEGHSPIRDVREIYDRYIWKELERNDAMKAEVYLNALGLLLRVELRGKIDLFGDRLKILAGCVTDQSCWFLEWHLDVLILWALGCSGELSKAEDLLSGLRSKISRMSKKKKERMQSGLLLAEAVFEYGKGNYRQAANLLGPDFDAINYKIIGASDEQVDVFNEVWYFLMLNTGQASIATEAIKKRMKPRENVPFSWRLLERGYEMLGCRQEADAAREKANYLENAFFRK